jgi:serine/threonine-protein kinase
VVTPELIAGRYRIEGLIGRGGMGAVYRARDTELDEVVALKVLSNELGTSADSIERFKREVKLARRVTHPNVARTFDIGEHAGTRFLTMEFIDGESLSDLMHAKGQLSLGRVLAIAGDICGGLSAAHKAGVVHRDLKPDNVMVASDGRVVITDFGIAREPIGAAAAKHTIGGIVGTPAYMAPEQVEARPDIDARADVFAFGVMLFELLTGQLPYKGESALTLAAARLYTDAPDPSTLRPDLPPGICQVVLRCLSREVAARFSDASELAMALANASPTMPQASSPRSVAPSGIQPVVSREKAVAVLPFRNVGAPEDDYVADGLSSELIDTLSMTAGLRVRPHGAVAQFKGATRDPRDIGRELEVDVIAEGSVRRAGDRVRLTVRLTSVEDGFQLWAQRFDRPANDLLVMSDETAHAISNALTVHAAEAHRQPLDALAVDLYLRARNEARQMGAGRVHRAIELFRAAHERAPNDVKILAGLARACARAWFFQGSAPADAAETARALAKRAHEAAPEDPEALLALATVHLMDQDVRAAAHTARLALAASPWNPDALEFVGRLLSESGRPDLAIQRLEAALQLDPTLRVARLEYVRVHALLGNYAKALEMLDSAVGVPDYEGDSVARARIALWSPDILASVLKLEVPDGDHARSPWRLVKLQQSVARGEPQDDMIKELAELGDQSRAASRFATLLYQILTELLIHLGRLDEAMIYLEKAVQSGLIDLSWIDGKTPVQRLAALPRFRELREPVAERGRVIREALGV